MDEEWLAAQEEYNKVAAILWHHQEIMDTIGRQAIRCFHLYGGTEETRDHPAYKRYLAAWKARSRYISNELRPRLRIIREIYR
jgi:hypothetical protein